MVVLNAHPSLSQSSCHDCKSFSKLPPPKALHAMVCPQCTSFPCIEFFSRLQVIFINSPPPKLCIQWYSSMHILPFHRVLVKIASHFLNFPPEKLCMQWYFWMRILPLHRVLVTIASHFLNFPPPKLCIRWYSSMHILPLHRVLLTVASLFINSPPPKALHAMVFLNANPSLA